MSKEIFLYSEDNKYKCVVELADSLDKFNCPDHSVMILFEERENGTYIIAQSRDKRLETEKDQQIANLEAKLAEKEEQLNNSEQKCLICHKDQENEQLKQQLTKKETEIKSLSSEISSLEQDLTHYKGEVYNLKDQLATKSKWLKIADNMVGQSKQDKISFCIEKLTDVRSFISDATEIKEPDYTKVCNYIEKQIKELKKEMK